MSGVVDAKAPLHTPPHIHLRRYLSSYCIANTSYPPQSEIRVSFMLCNPASGRHLMIAAA